MKNVKHYRVQLYLSTLENKTNRQYKGNKNNICLFSSSSAARKQSYYSQTITYHQYKYNIKLQRFQHLIIAAFINKLLKTPKKCHKYKH